MRKSPEDACVEYAIAVAEVRRLTRKIGDAQCIHLKGWSAGFDNLEESDWDALAAYPPSPETCLHKRFNMPTGPEGEIHHTTVAAIHAAMCSGCSEAFEYVQTRRTARRRVGGAKRSVEAVGKRLNAEVSRD